MQTIFASSIFQFFVLLLAFIDCQCLDKECEKRENISSGFAQDIVHGLIEMCSSITSFEYFRTSYDSVDLFVYLLHYLMRSLKIPVSSKCVPIYWLPFFVVVYELF